MPEVVAGFYLALMGTHLLYAVHEGSQQAVVGFKRNGGDEVGFLGQAHGFQQRVNAVCAHELSAVQQGKALFAFKFYGLPSEFVEHAYGLAAFSFVIYIAYADKGEKQIGERGEVARCAE
jgi:hypothetical protein